VAFAEALNALYSMINAKDKSTQDAFHTKVQTASTKLDSVLAGMTGADAKVAADFKAIWDQFKATREKEIIPAIYKGNTDEAKKITDGIQYERLSKMWSIMSCKITVYTGTTSRTVRSERSEAVLWYEPCFSPQRSERPRNQRFPDAETSHLGINATTSRYTTSPRKTNILPKACCCSRL
jgi:hypothetical protein